MDDPTLSPRESQEPVLLVPRDSATVLLLRDAPEAGLEVYMLRRHALSDVLGGMYVFPGGKLDPADCEEPSLCRIPAPLDFLHTALGEPSLAPALSAGLFFAACRETFEESRVLLARPAPGAGVKQAPSRIADEAWALLCEGYGFAEVLALLGMELDIEGLVPWSRWITPRVPSMMRKRFDTRFFVAALPAGQTAAFDEHEAVDGEWMTARQALRRFREGDIELGAPQIMSLLELASCRSATDVLEAARRRRPPLIEPEPFELDGVRMVAYPGDERHPLRERLLVGPTRLLLRGKRFELPEEIDALLGTDGR